MDFSDTTGKGGIIQRCEGWCGLGDGGISGNATLLKIFTAMVNEAFDELMPLLLSYSSHIIRWDDETNTDHPIATFNLTSGQADYTASVDDNSLAILDIKAVRILTSSSATSYTDIELITLDDDRAITAMTPNSTDVGVPTGWVKRGNTIFLTPKPNYSATSGIKILFERVQNYFASNDTTKEAGIPRIFHPLIPMIASHAWLLINRPENTALLTRLEAKTIDMKRNLRDLISQRAPSRGRMVAAYHDNR